MDKTYSIKNFIGSYQDSATATSDELLGGVLHLPKSGHDSVYIFDEKEKFLGLISYYHTIFRFNNPYPTKVGHVLFNPPSLTPESTIFEVSRHMLATNIYNLPVFDTDDPSNRKLIGKITIDDVFRFIDQDQDLKTVVAGNLLTDEPVTAATDANVGDVYNLLRLRGIPRVILVNEEGRVAGMVSRFDIARAFIDPSPRQRFDKGADSSGISFDEEEIFRKDAPAHRFQTVSVSTVLKEKTTLEALSSLIRSRYHDLVVVDDHNTPTAILSSRNVLYALMALEPKEDFEIVFQRPSDNVSEHEYQEAYEYLASFGKKLGKILKVQLLQFHLEEPKYMTGETAEFNGTLFMRFEHGASHVTVAQEKEFMRTVHEVCYRMEKKFIRKKEQIQSYSNNSGYSGYTAAMYSDLKPRKKKR